MDTSRSERRTPTFRQFAMVMAAVTWFALLLPVGARAAGQLVTLADPTTTQKARVIAPGALRVAEYNDPARLPITEAGFGTLSDATSGASGNIMTVPDGYRLVIETVSVRASLPTGERSWRTWIYYPGSFFVPLFLAGNSAGRDNYYGSERVELYVDPGEDVQWVLNRDSSVGEASVYFNISGHLVKI